jgi:HK97 family phage major capsid protein
LSKELPMNLDPSHEFAILARCVGRARGSLVRAAEIAEAMPGGQRVAGVLRSAIAAGTVADAVWAGPLVGYQAVATGFLESLRPLSAFDRMLGDGAMRRVPLKTRLAVSSIAAVGAEVGEWQAVPVSSLAVAGPGLNPRKVQALIAVTNEVLDGAGTAGAALLARELRAGVASASDGAFLAGLVTTSTATITGTASPLADLGAALETVNISATGKPYLVVDVHTANRLATKATTGGDQAFPGMTPSGGELAGVPVLVSDQAPAADSNGYAAMLIDASAIVGDSDTVAVDASEQAALQLLTDPAGGAQPMVSMFQTNSTALLATRWFGFELIRSSGVAVVTGAAW